jgi:hypothetical protein
VAGRPSQLNGGALRVGNRRAAQRLVVFQRVVAAPRQIQLLAEGL